MWYNEIKMMNETDTPQTAANDFDSHVQQAMEIGNQAGHDLGIKKAQDEALYLANLHNAADRIVAEPDEPTAKEKPHTVRNALLATGAVAAALAGGAAVNAEMQPHSSDDKTRYIVEPGDTLWEIVGTIPGAEKFDQNDLMNIVKNDPANIDILKDGLQPGETITVPIKFD